MDTTRNTILLPSGQPYDRSQAQDHTGLQFQSGPGKVKGDPRRNPKNFMKDAAWLECPRCKEEARFMILVEDHPMGDGMMQIYCGKCHDAWPVLQMFQPQMNNTIARQLGLPQAEPAGIDFEIDLDEGAE
jgi:hypothetical protein